ncbi:MAG: nitroreductase family protein [Candidatus Omnitrophota bacterium]
MINSFFKDLAQKRISVRRYKDTPIEADKIGLCLEAARLAPSACNSQPWKFIVVDDKTIKDELCNKAFSGIYNMNVFAKSAPVIIAVVSEKGTFFARVGGKIRNTNYYLIDIGIASEHFVLQAAELGLGTCMLGWFNERSVKRLLKVPRREKVDLLISIGYYNNTKKEKNRKSLGEIGSYNKY